MTSASVSNFLVQTATAPNQEQPLKEPAKTQEFKEMFTKSMELKDLKSPVPQINVTSPVVTGETDNQTSVKDTSNQYQSPNVKIKPREEKTVSEEDAKELTQQIESYGKEVKEAIAKELDISEEEVSEAMETLGLMSVDLIDPANIAKLWMNLTENDNPVSLLMDEGFSEIMDQVDILFNNLIDQTKFTPMEIKDILSEFSEIISVMTEEPIDEAVVEDENNQLPDSPMQTLETEAKSDDKEIEASNLVEKNPEAESEMVSKDVVATEDDEDIEVETKEQQPVEVKVAVETKDNDSKNDDSKDFKQDTFKEVKPNNSLNNDRNEHVFSPVNSQNEISFDTKTQVISFTDGRTVEVSHIIEQLVEQSKVTVAQEVTRLEMILNPEGLGKVYMELSQKGDEVTAKLFTQNEAVKEALENQMVVLKDSLSNGGGAKVTEIEVAVGTHEFERNLEEDMHNQERQEENNAQQRSSRRSINLSDLESLQGLMTEEEQLVAKIMKENGNQINFTA